MTPWKLAVATAATALLAANAAQAETVKATLGGFEQVPTLSTDGAGSFSAKIDPQVERIDYELAYENLSSQVLQAHIHLGAPAVGGGVITFLCTNLGNEPAGVPDPAPLCPGTTAGFVSGSIFPGDVVGPAGQGIEPGEFDELVAAIKAGVTYVNVHTETFPPGEIRGQVE